MGTRSGGVAEGVSSLRRGGFPPRLMSYAVVRYFSMKIVPPTVNS